MPLYVATLAGFVLGLAATYALWLFDRARGTRVLVLLAAISCLVATLVLRKLQP
jgi:hypothetical protein